MGSSTRLPGTRNVNKGWTVLLIGGASGTGKSTVAREIARRRDADWLQVDDLRLALQWSNARLPSQADTEALRFFLKEPDVWQLPAEQLRDGLIATGKAMMEAVAIVAGNHLAQNDPVVIEGDGILPEIVEHPDVRQHVVVGALRVAFIVPTSEDELLRNMVARGRGMADRGHPDPRRIAAMNWLYSQWLMREADAHSVPVVVTQPWTTLASRIAGDR